MYLETETHKSHFLEMCNELFTTEKSDGKFTQFKLLPLEFTKRVSLSKTVTYNTFLGWINDLNGRAYFASIDEFAWDILNALCEQRQKSPIETSKLICQFGLLLFNKFESQHPVDFLYNVYKS